MNETLMSALVLIPAMVIAIVFHEVSHGWTALALGDTTARDMRRLSLNPLRHVDPLGTVILPGVLALTGAPVFGWAKPVPVNARRLRNPRYGMMVVAAAGPVSNLVLAGVGAIALGLMSRGLQAPPEGLYALAMMGAQYFILINIFLALFNLLPIPPFDGSHIVEGLLPRDAARAYAKLRPWGLPLVFLLLLILPSLIPGFDLVGRYLEPVVTQVEDFYYIIAGWAAGMPQN
ncbi:peptidase M48 [Erythrobacter sp. SG61-1L]|uniref:site-2 protease family protein n=1 Tax=Erythrobacter sp. SG61-1L TaxID=1603897 RepID=UPI0006C908CC|nr:site-2 protease family protein [Erythrobacter sp. SG61-1L]KPL69768.1 peptidase M48 [Erythrobacter sp. SG61-1L]KPL69779.1 peptidase M48 [Erythrobacter sp. SG61-1L]